MSHQGGGQASWQRITVWATAKLSLDCVSAITPGSGSRTDRKVVLDCFFLHEATALWDLSYASATREVSPIEQHVHSFLEMLPLMGLLMIIVLHWPQFLSLFGLGPLSFEIWLKQPPLPLTYVGTVLALVLLFEVLPYLEEFWRTARARREARARGISIG